MPWTSPCALHKKQEHMLASSYKTCQDVDASTLHQLQVTMNIRHFGVLVIPGYPKVPPTEFYEINKLPLDVHITPLFTE
jgi:hypothetical protein